METFSGKAMLTMGEFIDRHRNSNLVIPCLIAGSGGRGIGTTDNEGAAFIGESLIAYRVVPSL